MSERDELADLLMSDALNDVAYYGRDYALAEADAILAAGYRKPRTVTTVEELDALPFETVIRDGDDCVLERWGDIEESGWVTVMVTSFVPRDQITLPATILYEPEASK